MEVKVSADSIYEAIFANGRFEVGISAGVDPALPEEDKLSVLMTPDAKKRAEHAAASFLKGKDPTDKHVILEAACAYAVAALNWLSWNGNRVVDGDAVATAAEVAVVADDKKKILSIDANKVITLILATKANWYVMNHHVGQGAMSGFVAKVYSLWFTDYNADAFRSVAWRAGHRASTWAVLKAVGLETPNGKLYAKNAVVPDLAADIKVRFSAAPAGTHKANVFVAAAKRLARSPLAWAVPDRANYFMVAASMGDLADPANHIGSRYLGYPDRVHHDEEYAGFLGRSGSFIMNILPKSDLARSPLLAKYTNYEDFNDSWEGLCKSYRAASATATDKAQALIRQTTVEEMSDEERIWIASLGGNVAFAKSLPSITAPVRDEAKTSAATLYPHIKLGKKGIYTIMLDKPEDPAAHAQVIAEAKARGFSPEVTAREVAEPAEDDSEEEDLDESDEDEAEEKDPLAGKAVTPPKPAAKGYGKKKKGRKTKK
jgi:hypothetical protein